MLGSLLAATCISLVAAGESPAGQPAPTVDYARDVRPILAKNCFACHGPDDQKRQAELRLDERDGATRELPSGRRAIAAGNPSESELLARLNSSDETEVMPPRESEKRPSQREIAVLRAWIEQGAAYTQHWSYVKPVRPALPAVGDRTWPTCAIDTLILARLEAAGLAPSAAADRYTLARRVSLDLTGLPLSWEQARQFAADQRPDAYERLVDHLLEQPTYGERWAAVWLDLARYADSSGYAHDPPRTIWRWRDRLIEALNENLPYDQFTIEQLAGDLLSDATPAQLIATGFHRNTLSNTEGGINPEEFRHAAIVDRVNTTMQVWMGTTLACAQCHNHKYDPFTQREYYRLLAIFNNTLDANGDAPTIQASRVGCESQLAVLSAKLVGQQQELDEETQKADASRTEWEASVDRNTLPKELAEVFAVPVEKRTKEQQDRWGAYHRSLQPAWKARAEAVAASNEELAKVSTSTPVQREGPTRSTHIHLRGEFQSTGDLVEPGLPAALHPASTAAKLDRLGMARWIVDPENPLTARVAVNRLWQEIFGVGIVATSEEFGMQGEPPTHPELLDWLASEYVAAGWDTKHVLKLIVTSATYRQSSHVSDELFRHDPFNRLLARGPRVRLSAEALRDQALFVGGLLSSKMYGPPVQPPQPTMGLPAAFGSSTDWESSSGEDRHRRALYTRWRRNLPYPSMTTFDAPERSVCSVRRVRTNTPLQALVTLNDPVFVEASQGLARRTLAETAGTTESRVVHGFRTALTRPPSEAEIRRLCELFEQAHSALAADPAKALALATVPIGPLAPGMDAVDAAAWTVVANVLLNLDETLAKP